MPGRSLHAEPATLRAATSDDVPLIPALAERIWWECYPGILSDEQIRYMLARMYAPERIHSEILDGVSWEILEVEDRPVGYAACEIRGTVAHLHKLYLGRAFQGRGLGRRLLERVQALAVERKADRMELRVNRSNVRALRFYRNAGFALLRDDCHPIGNGFVMDDHILSLSLR